MDKRSLSRCTVEKDLGRILEAVNGLEEFALVFPDFRDDIVELMEKRSKEINERIKTIEDAKSRIAAIGMLEILHSK
jgi:hypothetical protein